LLDFDRWDDVRQELGRDEFQSKVKVIHLNDSKTPFNGKKDRHELLGEGEIGPMSLETFLTSGLFSALPVVIETPVNEEAEYADEIARARHWAAGK
jgi:deoxyribonuclease-4